MKGAAATGSARRVGSDLFASWDWEPLPVAQRGRDQQCPSLISSEGQEYWGQDSITSYFAATGAPRPPVLDSEWPGS